VHLPPARRPIPPTTSSHGAQAFSSYLSRDIRASGSRGWFSAAPIRAHGAHGNSLSYDTFEVFSVGGFRRQSCAHQPCCFQAILPAISSRRSPSEFQTPDRAVNRRSRKQLRATYTKRRRAKTPKVAGSILPSPLYLHTIFIRGGHSIYIVVRRRLPRSPRTRLRPGLLDSYRLVIGSLRRQMKNSPTPTGRRHIIMLYQRSACTRRSHRERVRREPYTGCQPQSDEG